jgi:TRAP-type C4-dicarboxylate transport system permease small subunit
MENVRIISRFIDKLNVLFGIIAGSLVAAMSIVVLREVVGRHFFNSPVEWVDELATQYLLLGVFYLGSGYSFMAGGFVKVDFILNRLKPKRRALVELINCFIALGYCFVILWQGAHLAIWSLQRSMVSSGMGWPLFPTQVIVPIGTVLLILSIISLIMDQVKSFRKAQDNLNEGI